MSDATNVLDYLRVSKERKGSQRYRVDRETGQRLGVIWFEVARAPTGRACKVWFARTHGSGVQRGPFTRRQDAVSALVSNSDVRS